MIGIVFRGRWQRLIWLSCREEQERFANIYKILYITFMKPLEFRGGALDDLRGFPVSARREAGYQLDKVQNGHQPTNWKPIGTIGKGVEEIRIHDDAGAFRVIYIAKLAGAIYVLHCFQKKAQKTSKSDLDLATKRYSDLVRELGHER
jgi:phage-related protein